MSRRSSIARQAGIRLILSLGLFVVLIAFTSVGIYRAALQKAAHERAEDLVTFYKARVAQLERDWELQTRDFRVRVEFSRILETPETAEIHLQAFITIQGTDRRFQYLLIQDADGHKVFDFGKDLSLAAIPDSADEAIGHYVNPEDGQFYRVFQEQIWLGEARGMGRFALFFRLDNALLSQIGAPGITLSAFHGGVPFASSAGHASLARLERGESLPDAETRRLDWAGETGGPIDLYLEAPVKTLFTATELAIGMSAIPLVDGLILWFTIGIWLLRQTRRVATLGEAVDEYARERSSTPALEAKLAEVRLGHPDEINDVATAMHKMVAALDERERANAEANALLRASEARIREVTSSLADGVLVVDGEGRIEFVNPMAETLLGWSEADLLGLDSHETLHARTPDGGRVDVGDCAVHTAIRQGVSCRRDLDWFLRRDGGFLPIALVATPVHRDGRVGGAVVTFQDISQRLASEQALRESELRFRTLFNSSGDAVMVHPLFGPDGGFGRFVEVNDLACERLGYTRAELLGMTPLDLDEPGTFPTAEDIAAFRERVRETGHLMFERVHVTKDGLRIPVEISAHAFELGGQPMLLSVVRDVSERKRAEAEYKAILQTSHDGFWIVSARDGRFLDVNPAYCRMIGYSREELLDMRVSDVEALEKPEDTKRHIAAIIAGQENRFETQHRHKDGHVLDVEVSAKYMEARGGAIVVFVRDISERLAAERTVRVSEERLALAARSSGIGIWDWDVVADRLIWDDSMYRLYGLERGRVESVYQVWVDSLHPDDRARCEGEIEAALTRGRPFDTEFRIVRPDGEVRHVKAQASLFRNEAGAAVRMVGTNLDVTDEKHVAEALREAKSEAERANRAKSEFLANMSHEIRTPMNAIIGLSDLALGLPDLGARLRDYLDKIHSSAKALLTIINDILDYSKVEAGRLELDTVDFRLDDLLDNVANLFGVRAEEKGLEMVFDVAPSVPAVLVGDPLRLGQVMNNLVGNAVKFTQAGEIHVKVEEMGYGPGRVTLRFSVRDTGIGMSEEQMSRLFQSFTQADGSITRRFGGTGLGLAISKRLVEMMGGDIEVESQPGQGSRFSFTIELGVSDRFPVARTSESLRGMRVLVVDDLDVSRQILGELLTAWGFKVSEAASGEAALAALLERAGHPDEGFELVLLDWKMPGMDGVELARRVGELAKEGTLPTLPVIIMVTAYSREQLLENAQAVRLDAILTKPVTASGLFDAIMQIQGGSLGVELAGNRAELFERAAPIRGASVLLVEDNEINQVVGRDLLGRLGLRVEVANDGREAIEKLRSGAFDAVLMDLQMPVMDGFEAARRIRAEARWHDLPVIAMTAAVLERDREACRDAGMNDHVAKPILAEELVATLLKWLPPRHQAKLVHVESKARPAPPLRDLPGFDFDRVDALLDGNQVLFAGLAQRFAERFGDAGKLLAGHLAASDLDAAGCLLHAIKGAAGNLGALALHDAAQTLETDIKSGAGKIDARAFDAALAEVIGSIGRLKAAPVEDAPEFECERCDWRRAGMLISQIRRLLENYDYVPHELLAELGEAVACQPLLRQLERLARLVGNTDYDGARALLDELACAEGYPLDGNA